MDNSEDIKNNAKKVWSGFAPLENLTGTAAPRLIKFANINKNQKILDVACGTGVVALTAARSGANVFGSDLTPELLERAEENNKLLTSIKDSTPTFLNANNTNVQNNPSEQTIVMDSQIVDGFHSQVMRNQYG